VRLRTRRGRSMTGALVAKRGSAEGLPTGPHARSRAAAPTPGPTPRCRRQRQQGARQAARAKAAFLAPRRHGSGHSSIFPFDFLQPREGGSGGERRREAGRIRGGWRAPQGPAWRRRGGGGSGLGRRSTYAAAVAGVLGRHAARTSARAAPSVRQGRRVHGSRSATGGAAAVGRSLAHTKRSGARSACTRRRAGLAGREQATSAGVGIGGPALFCRSAGGEGRAQSEG